MVFAAPLEGLEEGAGGLGDGAVGGVSVEVADVAVRSVYFAGILR